VVSAVRTVLGDVLPEHLGVCDAHDHLFFGPERLDALGRAVHDALVETIGIPPDDRFQVLAGHDGDRGALRYDDYPDVHRDEGDVAIALRSGRTPRAEAGAVPADRRTGRRLCRTAPHNVFVTLTENQSIDWPPGNGVSQYSESGDGSQACTTTARDLRAGPVAVHASDAGHVLPVPCPGSARRRTRRRGSP
jgi:hypothetical protein